MNQEGEVFDTRGGIGPGKPGVIPGRRAVIDRFAARSVRCVLREIPNTALIILSRQPLGLQSRGVVFPASPRSATASWVDWLNNRRLLIPFGNIPPVEYEAMHYQTRNAVASAAGVN